LAAKEMSRLFPTLWATKKAAKRWLEKEPLAAHSRDIIRVWGLLHEYRPPGQTSWSKAQKISSPTIPSNIRRLAL
jgi:hypothetical protein